MTEKTRKGRRPSRERMPTEGTVLGAIEGAIETLTELRDEFQEIVDNASEGLQQTERHQTREATVEALSFVDDGTPDIPEEARDLPCSWTENRHPKASRAARRDNAVAALSAALSELEDWKSAAEERQSADDEAEKDRDEDLEQGISDAEESIATLEQWISDAESTEWPGMFG